MSIVFGKNSAGKDCMFEDCGECRECAQNPSRISCGCEKGGYYTTNPKKIVERGGKVS